MKPAQIFHQYIWIINTLRAYGQLTFEELNQKWQEEGITDGNPLYRSSFNRHRDAILNMFGIIIDCDQSTYQYYISNDQVLGDDSVERWLFSTLTVHGVLSDGASVKECVVLENVPAGEEYLETILAAIKHRHRLTIGYQKFGAEGYEKTVCPYALKLFHQRWYLLACTADDQMRVYALDRMTTLGMTDESFEIPDGFSPQGYFSEYYGVLTDNTPLAHVVIRAYDRTPNYLRTLPLHHSQRELPNDTTGSVLSSRVWRCEPLCNYTDFSFDIRPTADFLAELLSHGNGIEVLEPTELRQKMRQMIAENLKRY
jgi:hypothetical protein